MADADGRVAVPLWPTRTPLPGTAGLETPIIDLARFASIEALTLGLASAGGTAAVRIEMALSHDREAFSTYSELDDLSAAPGAEYTSAAGATQEIPLRVTLAPYIRLRLTGLPENAADTEITLVLWALPA